MQLHTRVIVRARYANTPFWNREEDFGIKYQPDRDLARQDPKVVERIERLKKFYPVVDVYFRDTN